MFKKKNYLLSLFVTIICSLVFTASPMEKKSVEIGAELVDTFVPELFISDQKSGKIILETLTVNSTLDANKFKSMLGENAFLVTKIIENINKIQSDAMPRMILDGKELNNENREKYQESANRVLVRALSAFFKLLLTQANQQDIPCFAYLFKKTFLDEKNNVISFSGKDPISLFLKNLKEKDLEFNDRMSGKLAPGETITTLKDEINDALQKSLGNILAYRPKSSILSTGCGIGFLGLYYEFIMTMLVDPYFVKNKPMCGDEICHPAMFKIVIAASVMLPCVLYFIHQLLFGKK